MNCPERCEALNALLDDELPAAEIASLAAHRGACAECARHLQELAQFRVALQEAVAEAEVSGDFQDRIAILLEAEAAPGVRGRHGWLAAVVAVAATIVVMLIPRHDETKELTSVHDEALRAPIQKSAIAQSGLMVPQFQLVSARKDVVAGHKGRVLSYSRAGQGITLCIWSAGREPTHAVRAAVYQGICIKYLNDGSQEYWALTTGSATVLVEFVSAIRPTVTQGGLLDG